jgi:hypothetical protein
MLWKVVFAKSPYAIVYATYKSLGTQNKTYYIYSLPISVFCSNFAYLSMLNINTPYL